MGTAFELGRHSSQRASSEWLFLLGEVGWVCHACPGARLWRSARGYSVELRDARPGIVSSVRSPFALRSRYLRSLSPLVRPSCLVNERCGHVGRRGVPGTAAFTRCRAVTNESLSTAHRHHPSPLRRRRGSLVGLTYESPGSCAFLPCCPCAWVGWPQSPGWRCLLRRGVRRILDCPSGAFAPFGCLCSLFSAPFQCAVCPPPLGRLGFDGWSLCPPFTRRYAESPLRRSRSSFTFELDRAVSWVLAGSSSFFNGCGLCAQLTF